MGTVRYMHRFTGLDVPLLKESLQAPKPDKDYPWDILNVGYEVDSQTLFPIHNGFIPTRAAFDELMTEFQQFYDCVSDEEIADYNSEALKKRYDPVQPQVKTVKQPRIFPDSPDTKPLKAVNPRDEVWGYIYLFGCKDNAGFYKIGLARDVEKRARQVGRVDIIHSFCAGNMAQAERHLQTIFLDYRYTGEWFVLVNDHIDFIKSIVAYRQDRFVMKEGDNV